MFNLLAIPSVDASVERPGTAANRSDRSILLVDDNEDLRGTTADFLRDRGFTVTEASDASEAQRLWRDQGGITTLVTDLRMPGGDGLELAERLRGQRRDLPVLLISSHLDPRLSARLERGDIAYRSKPFSADALVAGLEEAHDRVRLIGSSAERQRPSTPARRNRSAHWPLAIAAVMVTVIGMGLLLAGGRPPALPEVEARTPRRSVRVEPLAPRGVQSGKPGSLLWREIEGASRYRLRLFRPGDELLWETESEHPPAVLPVAIEAVIENAVRYRWRVEALDEQGNRIAWSEAASFWLEPPASALATAPSKEER